ncbi:MAG: hypothetical protein CSYNP_03529 [Syntrophus sp. SKADARSKE-3]|nr:hypothetical protein [Syntrophus sp. SKADARSKE-3]
MKALFQNVIIALLSFLLISCSGNGSGSSPGLSLDSRMTGTWVADRVTADQDTENDQSTVILLSDGTGKIVTSKSASTVMWRAKDGQIITVNNDTGEIATMAYLFGNTTDQVVLTIVIDGKPITQNYHKVTENYPANLIGSWSCYSLVVNGTSKPAIAIPDLQLQSNGTGSVMWSVSSDGAFVWLNPTTQLGGISSYGFQNSYLVLTDNNDTITMTAKYNNSNIPPPINVNAVSSYPCSVGQGFNLDKDAQILVGHIDYIKIGGVEMQNDFTVTNPEDFTKSKSVFGIVENIAWYGGYADPIIFTAQVSTTNRNTLAALKRPNMSDTTVEFSFTIYEYDPAAKKYFKCFHTDSMKLKGLIQKSAGDLVMYTSAEMGMEVVSPKNYSVSLGVMPQNLNQSINMAVSVRDKFVKKWGTTVTQ